MRTELLAPLWNFNLLFKDFQSAVQQSKSFLRQVFQTSQFNFGFLDTAVGCTMAQWNGQFLRVLILVNFVCSELFSGIIIFYGENQYVYECYAKKTPLFNKEIWQKISIL